MSLRSRPVPIVLGGFCAGLLLLGAARARAGEAAALEGTRFHLAYAAPASCPDRAAFLSAIRLRTRRPQLAADGEPALSFSVSVEPRQGSMVGRLEVRDPEARGQAAPERRTVSSGTCPEVTKALALVVALLLDPDAETGPEPTAGALADPPHEQQHEQQKEELRAPEDERGLPLPPTPRSQRRPAREHLGPRPQAHRPVALSAGAELAMTGAVGPQLAPMAQGFMDIASTQRGQSEPGLAFAPALRLGVGVAATSSDLPIGSHGYWWAGVVARLCPVRVALPGALGLRPCGAMQVGAHHGGTDGVPNRSQSTDVWLAPEAGATLDWELTSSVALELHGGAVFPLVRTRFFLAPNTTIFSVPAVAGSGSIAARVRFW